MSEKTARDTGNHECEETDGVSSDGGSSISLSNNPDETKPGDLTEDGLPDSKVGKFDFGESCRPPTEDDAVPVVTDSGPTLQARYHDRERFNEESIAYPNVIDEEELENYSRYNMNHKKRGIALIFNNEKFKDDKLKQRVGTAEDGRALSDTLKGIGFEVRIHNDKKLDDMWKEIDKVANMDHSDHDCLLVAFMTHGLKNGAIYATDRSFNVEEALEKFKTNKVPTLSGKPKIFLFQACRGTKQDVGVKALKNTRSSVTTNSASVRYFSLPTTADFLFLYSSMEGYVSRRSTTKGTWFIQDLCKELNKDARTKDILSIVTNTLKRVALTRFARDDEAHSTGWQQMPVFMSTLTRILYFYET